MCPPSEEFFTESSDDEASVAMLGQPSQTEVTTEWQLPPTYGEAVTGPQSAVRERVFTHVIEY